LVHLLLVRGIPVNGPRQLDFRSARALFNQKLKHIDLDHKNLPLKRPTNNYLKIGRASSGTTFIFCLLRPIARKAMVWDITRIATAPLEAVSTVNRMADDDKAKIHFICEVESGDSPSLPLIEEIARYLVEPAIPPNVDYRLDRGDFRSEPGSLDHYTIDMMASDDLVIVDLTALTDTAYFVLGARAYKGLPIVYICDEAYPVRYDLRSDRLVRYSMSNLGDSVLHLREEIARALSEEPGSRTPQVQLPPLPPREMRLELANRIEATAEVIRILRINSVSESVDELIAIADELKRLPEENNPSRLQEAADKALNVIFSLLDELSTQPGARMAITGALSLIVGGTGTSGAAAFSAGLAFWYGKDVFTKFINAWGKRSAPAAKTTKKK
jgi:hypothetical protein